MIKILLSITFLFYSGSALSQDVSSRDTMLVAQNSKKRVKKTTSKKTTPKSTKTTKKSGSASSTPKASGGGSVISQIKSLASNGQFAEASKLLFSISRNPKNAAEAAQLKYMLGLMLMELKLHQVASFVFYDVIDEELKRPGDGKYMRQALGKLSYLSNILESDVLLKYAVSRIRIADFPEESRDLFFYRYGELKMKEGDNKEAAKAFSRVEASSNVYPQALYKQGLAYAEDNMLGKSVAAYEELLNMYSSRPVTDPNRVNAALALARVYYQAKKWDASVNYYRLIPRDTIQWHDALFEMSWAMMRTGQFRSASSNFHTLHSPYYDDVYAPEGLLLRGIIYLYICRYDEMEKVLDLFAKIYKPAQNNISKMLERSDDSRLYWDELKKTIEIDPTSKGKKKYKRLNDMVLNALVKHPQIKSNMHYYNMLQEESALIDKLSPDWRSAAIGKFSHRIIDRRRASTQDLVGKLAKNHLLRMKSELRDFFEQSDFLQFEMINGKKEAVGKEIAGKRGPRKQITDGASRNFFIANGYQYWTFQGEYWLDELGNYHYVGVQACE